MSTERGELARHIREAALGLGFVRAGFTSVESFTRGQGALERWLAHGRHGEMAYMTAHAGRAEPRSLLAEAKSIIVVALRYPRAVAGDDRTDDGRPRGVVARYARGADYHLVMREKLAALAARVREIAGGDVRVRACVDSAPILEREAAARAGVGFLGVSTMTIVPGIGTYVLLGELLVDLELPPDPPAAPRCGRCTTCLEACPTRAFVGPFVLDARRCISYLTIEHKGSIPRELRPLMGRRVFGCDVCQEVCPFNASKRPQPHAPELEVWPELAAPVLEELLLLGAARHRKLVAGTALRRITRHQLARNAAVALGNAGDPRALRALVGALETHPSPLVREHAAWAIGRLAAITGGTERAAASAALERAANADAEASVRDEAQAARAALTAAEGRSAPPQASAPQGAGASSTTTGA